MSVTFAVAAIGGGGGGLFMMLKGDAPLPAPTLLNIVATQVEGPGVGTAKSPYVLVEFMDYQCPPCRANRGKIKNIVKLYGNRMQLVVRHLPLPMHHNALSAAAAAEAAREQGKFWPMHDALLAGGSLDAPEIKSLADKIGLNEARFQTAWVGNAKERVQADQETAEAIGLNSTPSFLLCTSKGQVWRLNRLEQIHELVK